MPFCLASGSEANSVGAKVWHGFGPQFLFWFVYFFRIARNVIRFRLGCHFVEAGCAMNGDEEAIFPFEVDFAAKDSVIAFHALDGAQIRVWLAAIASLGGLEIEPWAHGVIPAG